MQQNNSKTEKLKADSPKLKTKKPTLAEKLKTDS